MLDAAKPSIVILLMFFVFAVSPIPFTISVFPSVLFVSFANPVLPYKVHRSLAGIVFVAMLVPVFLVAWRHVEIKWLPDRGLDDYDGSLIDHPRRRIVPDSDLTVHTRLIDPDGHTNIRFGNAAKSST